jgi:hypothetical protein
MQMPLAAELAGAAPFVQRDNATTDELPARKPWQKQLRRPVGGRRLPIGRKRTPQSSSRLLTPARRTRSSAGTQRVLREHAAAVSARMCASANSRKW